MHSDARRTARRHWAEILDCRPESIFGSTTTVAEWTRNGVEILCWEGGAVVGAPPALFEALRENVDRIPFDIGREGAQTLVEPVAAVDDVLGPQFVGYCDETAFDPVDREVQQIEPRRLDWLRDACPDGEWERSGLSVDADVPTFAVLRVDRPIAAVQYGVVDGVAKLAVASHPAHRGEGHAKATVSAATAHALDRGYLVEYRTVERWTGSVALAEGLGFERVARSLLVELK
ncbi:hypothetical protein I7X12_13280 [Halosimplex litoreum]|uniref:N-acetyltransferase domain-containing protein n=1 Tax=Halosimplex litoreum TaxID=1198301 RepID=A0A7T3FVY3_9EURY|nr:GNAT family N-acetyltransferase [Halosimplex litoreum]QPV61720.1 hypothetical protein I7X12_13280 [Halosimplex litoreum]